MDRAHFGLLGVHSIFVGKKCPNQLRTSLNEASFGGGGCMGGGSR